MANINDLKQTNDIVIDATSDVVTEQPTRVQMPKPKTIVLSKSNAASKETRATFDLSSAPKDTSLDENVHESLAKDILEGEDSIFNKYVQNKTKEMNEWMEEKEEEIAMQEDMSEDSDAEERNDILGSLNQDTLDDSNIIEFTAAEDNLEVIDDLLDDEEEEAEEVLEKVEDEEIVEEKPAAKEEAPKKVDTSDIELDDNTSSVSELEILEEEDDSEEAELNSDDEVIKHLKEMATEKLKPVSQKLDISSFTILKKPTTNTKFLNQQNVKVAKWVLPGQESIVQMKEFLGSEIEELREYSEDSASISSLTKRFRMIYDHIASAKPSTYEAWLKCTPYDDIDHYFFAIYIACFKGSNYIPVDCSNKQCNETFLSDDIPIMNMVKFDSEEAKSKFQKIYQNESGFANKNGLYVTEVVPLSNNIAVAFKEASIYNLIEIASLDAKFRTKYSSVLDYIPYIDSLYLIDKENKSLEPIGYKGYADNATKTIKSKISKYDSVLKSLTIDEFSPIKSYIAAIRDRKPGYSYIFPAITCPKCGTATQETDVTAEEMVFTRYQLGNLVTTSIN